MIDAYIEPDEYWQRLPLPPFNQEEWECIYAMDLDQRIEESYGNYTIFIKP